jgi:hypothetical protein
MTIKDNLGKLCRFSFVTISKYLSVFSHTYFDTNAQSKACRDGEKKAPLAYILTMRSLDYTSRIL